MSHGVNKKAPPIVSPQRSFLPGFSAGLFAVLQEIFCHSCFALNRLLQKIIHFQSKRKFFLQFIAGRF